MSFNQLICRVCLAIERKMFKATIYETEFKDLTGVTISASNELPQWLCYECTALLQKCVRFRNKAMQSHYMLTQYMSWNVPITSHKDASSYLSLTTIEHCDYLGTYTEQTDGSYIHTVIPDVEVKDEVVTHINALVGNIDSESVDVKEECPAYDEITLEEWSVDHQVGFRSKSVHKPNHEDLTLQTEAVGGLLIARSGASKNSVQTFEEMNKHPDTTSVLQSEGDISDSDGSDNNSPKKAFSCKQCKKSFDSNDLLTSHVQEHYRPYKCEVCLKNLATKNSYNRHIRIHTGERPYRCDTCSKGFITIECLHKHQRIHTIGKPYRCDVCKKCYRYKSHLKVHNRIHTGDKPYKCEVCEKAFSIGGHLKKHYRTHHRGLKV